MSITIRKIAELTGFSRGTVDRVLNNRGRVHPDTRKKILEQAKSLGYQPNKAGRALAIKKKKHVIGVILCSTENKFFDDIIVGIREAEKEYVHYGISIELRTMKGFKVQKQLDLIDSLIDNVSALIISPIDDNRIRTRLNEIYDSGIPIINLNIDIENSKRVAYVGADYYQAGKIAGGLTSLLKPEGAKIGIVYGSDMHYGHRQRIDGFRNELDEKYQIIAQIESQDNDEIAFENTIKLLENYELDTIYIVSAGVYGVCLAAEKHKGLTIISFDDISETIDMLKKGVIKVTISQQPKYQGLKAVQLMFKYLLTGEIPENREYITENQIRIKQLYT